MCTAKSACSCCRTRTFQVDDYVVVHVGYAIQKITPAEARTAWEMYDLMLAGEPGEGDAHA